MRRSTRARTSIKDGSLVVVPLRGHTPGSVGIFVNLSPGRRMFYVGDAVDDERGFEERVRKSMILLDSDNVGKVADQIVGRLTDLHEKVPRLAIYSRSWPQCLQEILSGRAAELRFKSIGALKRKTRSSGARPRK